jgi:hypothetical protein
MQCVSVRVPSAIFVVGALLGGCASEPSGPAAPVFTNPTPAEHTQRFFPISTGVHALACDDCHGNTATFAQVDCTGCHTQAEVTPFHAPFATPGGADGGTTIDVGGFQFLASGTDTSALCVRCHADYPAQAPPDEAPVHRLADHAFVITPGPFDPGHKHYGASCLVCHPATLPDKPFATDFAGHQDCSPCHGQPEADAIHAGMAGYSYATDVCLTCHPTGGI